MAKPNIPSNWKKIDSLSDWSSTVCSVPISEVDNMASHQESLRYKKLIPMKSLATLAVGKIIPDWGKTYYVDKSVPLAEDIKKRGLQNPIQIWIDKNGNKTIGDGHHRYMAAKMLGHTHINARVIHNDTVHPWFNDKKRGFFKK